jgi:tRNA-2-methylthio-N6-dimethylallyladenosine synthase
MNRKHTAADYFRLVDRIRAARPDIALSTDIIVGFPGETEEEFEETLELVRRIEFAQAFSFKFSARPGTPAASLPGQIDDEVKSARLLRLQELLDAGQARFYGASVGRILPVLFDKRGTRAGQLVGRSPYLQLVHAPAPDNLLGRIVPVEIAAAGPNSLSGVISAP